MDIDPLAVALIKVQQARARRHLLEMEVGLVPDATDTQAKMLREKLRNIDALLAWHNRQATTRQVQ